MELNILYTMAALVVIAGVWLMKAEANSPSAPAEVPVPDTHDRDIKAELSDLRKAIERIHESAARHDEYTEDAFRDVGRRIDRIERGVERIDSRMDADARIGAALTRLGRPAE